MTLKTWVVWAVILMAQNFSFTFVSRARNSGSLKRHMVAAFLSNGVWFASQVIATSAFLEILSGKFGWKMTVFAGIFYTLFTLVGSLVAHHYALNSEKGNGAVGANKKFAQVTKEQWDSVWAQHVLGLEQ